ncbi:MAG: hypothetical protein IKA11_02505 [Clostridia bacterium]|nr:hypothetical protein [Clostridia bacterium]
MKLSFNRRFLALLVALTLILGMFIMPQITPAKADTLPTDRYYDYSDGIALAAESETINYARKETTNYELPYGVPSYYPVDMLNACGPVAGGIVVGYYDKYFENLIPNFTAYFAVNGRYRGMNSNYVLPMLQEMYTLMRTNVDDVGVSQADCLNGLETFVENKGLSLTYSSVKSSTFIDSAYINAINNMQPVLIFAESIDLYGLYVYDGYDYFSFLQSSQAHIVVGYGYRTIRYYDANDNLFRTDNYLMVSSGWSSHSLGFVKVNNSSWMNAAYAVEVN